MSNRRLLRLYAEHERLTRMFASHSHIRIVETSGDPPDRYVIEYHLRGKVETPEGKIEERQQHSARITLGADYPRELPRCEMLTPVYHPNINFLAVCTADIGAAGQTLDDLIVFIGRMIAYQTYNLQSPLNGDAARWTEEHMDELPLDRVDLTPQVPSEAELDLQAGSLFRNDPVAEFPNKALRVLPDLHLSEGPVVHSVTVDQAVPNPTAASPPVALARQGHCSNCGQEAHAESDCNGSHVLCADCHLSCGNCHSSVCLVCGLVRCQFCRSIVCSDCAIQCTACGMVVCPEHTVVCRLCGRMACPSCSHICLAIDGDSAASVNHELGTATGLMVVESDIALHTNDYAPDDASCSALSLPSAQVESTESRLTAETGQFDVNAYPARKASIHVQAPFELPALVVESVTNLPELSTANARTHIQSSEAPSMAPDHSSAIAVLCVTLSNEPAKSSPAKPFDTESLQPTPIVDLGTSVQSVDVPLKMHRVPSLVSAPQVPAAETMSSPVAQDTTIGAAMGPFSRAMQPMIEVAPPSPLCTNQPQTQCLRPTIVITTQEAQAVTEALLVPPPLPIMPLQTVRRRQVSGKAIASLVFGVLGFPVIGILLGIFAIIFARMAFHDMALDKQLHGQKLAAWGMALGIIAMLLWILLFIVWFNTGSLPVGGDENHDSSPNVFAGMK